MDASPLEIARYLNARETASRVWELTLVDAGPGWATVRMPARHDMLNGHGKLHGALIFAIADSAFAYACNSRNLSSVAFQASVVFLAPVEEGDLLEAHARETAGQGRSSVYAVTVINQRGETVAAFQGISRTRGEPVIKFNNED